MPPSDGSRIEGIEGLRAIAAGSILVYHVWLYSSTARSPDSPLIDTGPVRWLFPHLSVGVTLFFTLSGFLLYLPFARRLLRGEPGPGVRSYLRNRALRVLPAYWLVLGVTGAVLATLLVRRHGELGVGSFADDPGLLPLASVLGQNYDPGRVLSGVGPAWSLVVEVAFYLVLPALAAAAVWSARSASTPRARRRAAAVPAVLLLVTGLTGKVLAWWLFHRQPGRIRLGADWQTVVEKSLLGQADLFAFGVLLAVVFVEVRDGRLHLPARWRPAVVVAALALAAVTHRYGTPELSQRGEPSHYVYGTATALGCALLLAVLTLSLAEGRRLAAARVLETRLLHALGLISYGAFLWHEPITLWLMKRGLLQDGRAGFLVNLAAVLAITIVLSALTYRFVESPLLRLKRRPAAAVTPGDPPSVTTVHG